MSRIRDVWSVNLEAEMRTIRDLVDSYPYIAMDTEFPGVVARPIGSFKTSSDYHYQTMRCNVDLLRIIQVGITLADEEGSFPQDAATWQFNFRFSLATDMYAPESIELLQKSGFDFARHEEYGIDPNDFAELMITSGLVLNPDVKWLSFHSGYDFGYYVKLLTAQSLPPAEDVFFDELNMWFPHVYDIKFMMRACKSLKGGLQDIADDLGVLRIGTSHQAGSDSLLTASVFFKMRELFFEDQIDDDEYSGKLYGLGQTFTSPNGMVDPGRNGATIAEREDRAVPLANAAANVAAAAAAAGIGMRDGRSGTPAPGSAGLGGGGGGQHVMGMGMGMGSLPTPALGGAMPTPLPAGTTYGPMSANAQYIRTSIVGGR